MPTFARATPNPLARHGNPIGLTILGIGWLSVAATLGYVALNTPIVGNLVFSGRVTSSSSAAGLLAMVMIATVPLSLATAGVARLAEAFSLALEPRPSLLGRVAGSPSRARPLVALGAAAAGTVPEVADGLFGAVAVQETADDGPVPVQSPWEMDVAREWLNLNEPLRGLGRLSSGPGARRHPAGKVGVKVYAAVVTGSWEIQKGSGCAILRPDQILPYLATDMTGGDPAGGRAG